MTSHDLLFLVIHNGLYTLFSILNDVIIHVISYDVMFVVIPMM